MKNPDEKNENTETQSEATPQSETQPQNETKPRVVQIKPLNVEINPPLGKLLEILAKIAVPIVASVVTLIVTLVVLNPTLKSFDTQTELLDIQTKMLNNQADAMRIQQKQFEALLEKQTKRLETQLESQTDITRKQIAAEQFNNAIEHLGSEKQMVVLGGIHALHNLAMNYPEEYSSPVFEVLCSFIRVETTKSEFQKSFLENKNHDPLIQNPIQTFDQPATMVIQLIIDKLFCEKQSVELYRKHQKFTTNLCGVFLCRANLEKVDLQMARLWNANLQRSFLLNTDLQKAELFSTHLQGAYLWSANLQGAYLWNAKLQGANLWNAKLQEAWVEEDLDDRISVFQDTDFRGVQSKRESYGNLEIAANNGFGLKTDLSGITLYDEEGNELDLGGEQKKVWLRERGAIVDDLTAEEVQQLAKELGIIKDEEKPQQPVEEPTPEEEPQQPNEPTTLDDEPQLPADEPIPQE